MSLMEVMVVVLILGLGLGSAFSAMGSANATRQRTEARNLAMAAIQSQVEIFQALDQQALDGQFAASDTLGFDILGLRPVAASGNQVGTIKRISRISGTSVRSALRFRVDYQNASGDDRVTVYYFHAPRN